MKKTNRKLPKEVIRFMQECREKENPQSYLISVLHKLQKHHGYLSEECMDEIAQQMQIPAAFVSGTATFYHFFRLQPKGRYSISICRGTACFVKGADEVYEAFKNELGIEMGETTTDGLFSIDNSRCVGICALAPVVTVNDTVYSEVTPEKVPQIIHVIKKP